jgi:hypothetical protein
LAPPQPLFSRQFDRHTHEDWKFAKGRRGEGGAKSYDGKEAWSSVHHSVLSDWADDNLLTQQSIEDFSNCAWIFTFLATQYTARFFILENSKTELSEF